MRQQLSGILLLILITVVTSPLLAQQKVIYPHSVFWSKTEVNQIFENKVGVGADFVYRRKNELNTGSMFDAHLRTSIRPWVHYQFSPYARLSVSPLGYMRTTEYIGTPEDYNRLPYHELRTTFQFFHHIKQMQGRLMHTWRYRYELRWQEMAGTDDYRFLNRFRFRYRIRYVFNTNDFYEDGAWYAAVSNEIGLNFGRNVYLNTFNQNRLYVGIGHRFFNAIRAEVRYVDRIRSRGATGYEFDHGRGLMIGLYVDQLSKIGRKDVPQVKFGD